MERRLPPNRRTGVNRKIVLGNVVAHVSVYFYADGTPCEIWMNGPKAGAPFDLAMRDAAIGFSLALQYGIPAVELEKSLSLNPERQVTDDPDAKRGSHISAAIAWVASLGPFGEEKAPT